jgi:hypothetical protein
MTLPSGIEYPYSGAPPHGCRNMVGMTTPVHRKTTTAFFVQAALSFGVSLLATGVAIVNLPATPWVRAFLALSVLYVVTSSFTLAKCVRDHQESTEVVSRVDQARLDRLLAEHDPFKVQTG